MKCFRHVSKTVYDIKLLKLRRGTVEVTGTTQCSDAVLCKRAYLNLNEFCEGRRLTVDNVMDLYCPCIVVLGGNILGWKDEVSWNETLSS